MARRPFVCGNWKMHTRESEAVGLAQEVVRLTSQIRDVDVGIAPPYVWLAPVAKKLEGSHVGLSAQNVHHEEKGAFTGEIAPSMLVDVGCKYVIIGHSERRQFFGDDDAWVNRKMKASLAAGLSPILCVGESLDEREAGKTMDVVETQTRGGLSGLTPDQLRLVTIAYEPVWAIGTGRTATPDQAQEVHAFIRRILQELGGVDVGDAMRIQYGGSVKPDNAVELMSQPDIDGALVGGAALQAESFAAIIKAARPS